MLEDTIAAPRSGRGASRRTARGRVPRRRLPAEAQSDPFLDRLRDRDRAVAGGDLAALARSGVPALAGRDLSGAVRPRALGRSVGPSFDLADAHRLGLGARHRARPHRRHRHGAVLGRRAPSACRWCRRSSRFPKIALLPLFILWLGIGEAPKIVTIASGVFFPTVIATFSGIDSVPRNLIRMAQSFNVPDERHHLEDRPAVGACRASSPASASRWRRRCCSSSRRK